MTAKRPRNRTKNPDILKRSGERGTQLPSSEDILVTEALESPKERLATSFFAYSHQTFIYDVVARRICWDCFNRLSIAEILDAPWVCLKDSIEATQSISELKQRIGGK